MAQLIKCPDCDKQLQTPEDLLGKHVQCPACKLTFIAALPAPASYPGPAMAAPPEVPVEEPPRKRMANEGDDRYEDGDDRPIRRRPGSERKPGKVQAIGIMSLVGGILAILLAIGLGAGTGSFCCLWPGTYYSLVFGIIAVVRASAILGARAHLQIPPTGLAIMHMVNIINLDVANLVLGIIIMIFCNDEEVREYMAK
jgi:hypothetical protein